MSFFKRYSFKCVVNRLDNVKTNKHFINWKSMTMRRFRNFCIFCNVILIYNPFKIYFNILSIKIWVLLTSIWFNKNCKNSFFAVQRLYFFKLMHFCLLLVAKYWQLTMMPKNEFSIDTNEFKHYNESNYWFSIF